MPEFLVDPVAGWVYQTIFDAVGTSPHLSRCTVASFCLGGVPAEG